MGYLGTKPANSPLTSELIPDGMIGTSDLANGAVTLEKMSQKMTQGTAVTASGASVDFTGIPSWVRRITVMFSSLSTNGSSSYLIQLGSGSVTTSGYAATGAFGGTGVGVVNSTAGMIIYNNTNTATMSGQIVITNISGNSWVSSHSMRWLDGYVLNGGGTVALSGVLDRVRITTVNGTDTFDAGTINIMYEG